MGHIVGVLNVNGTDRKMGSPDNIPHNDRPRFVLVESMPGVPPQFIIYNGEPCEGEGVVMMITDKRDLHRLIAAANRELERL